MIDIPLSIRFQPHTLILADMIGSLLSLVVILIWPDSRTALWLGSLGLGLSIASIFPNTLSLAGQHMPITGRVTSLLFVGASLGGMFFPWFIGQLIGPFGPLSIIWVLVIIGLLAMGVYIWMIASARRSMPSNDWFANPRILTFPIGMLFFYKRKFEVCGFWICFGR